MACYRKLNVKISCPHRHGNTTIKQLKIAKSSTSSPKDLKAHYKIEVTQQSLWNRQGRSKDHCIPSLKGEQLWGETRQLFKSCAAAPYSGLGHQVKKKPWTAQRNLDTWVNTPLISWRSTMRAVMMVSCQPLGLMSPVKQAHIALTCQEGPILFGQA